MLINRLRDLAVKRGGLAGRYTAVSVLNVVNHQILLNLANSGWGWSGGRANVFAAVISAVPAYYLSRQWVWKVQGTHSVRNEIAPFWILSLLGLLVSTVLAESADRLFEAWYWVAGASLLGYFIVWVAKFVVLDRLFNRAAERGRAADESAAAGSAA
ncbi:MAG: GtrA family protein [Actinomycetota bacterium]